MVYGVAFCNRKIVVESVNDAWKTNGIPSGSDDAEPSATKGTKGEENPI